MDTVLLLLPDFSLIALGVLLRRHGGFGDDLWAGLERLVYFVLFPALLFGALARVEISLETTLPLFLSGLAVMVSGFVLGWLPRRWMGLAPMSFASRLQCAYRFNTYIGMAVAGQVFGAAGLATMGVLCGTMVPFANVMAVSVLARHGQGRIGRELMRNPLILATLAGLLFNAAGLSLPVPAAAFLGRLADASIALGLLAVGAALRWGRVGGHWGGSVWIAAVKLLALPTIAWSITGVAGLDGVARGVLVLFAALPSASSAYILATRMGGDGPGVAWLISATTLAAMPTMACWLALVRG
ncbi:AEC family transporter [Nitrogeniibacter mangrovi]|uniref:AEC family transporter n=1 Tax=Nitrogeniibacter mangrovi TaxID=2016596 RepID=A0A6C1B6M9_9RHOO|nr:AEC family transporter [Nitrogeniibacter mangrovi]QID19083.1 AEC family transporter [Nitrogeniibacter mangrovi]